MPSFVITIITDLYWVYFALIFVRIIFSWTGIPSGALLQIYKFVYDATEPYLGLFRRIIPAVGMFDFSPFIGVIVLYIVTFYIVIPLLEGL